ncbi:MAG TPA: class I SAM-dependent methyltransferase [Gammaproteobacteria bacterium]|jgi:16S rRNA (guanine1516-N2)-methyltransferase|nr:class I SAM-dependent methyltransferase [Gammaproteobacteria bacterium]
MTKTITVTADHPDLAEQAKALARELNLPYQLENTDYQLTHTKAGLTLQNNHEKKCKPLLIDFGSTLYARRLAKAGRNSEMLVQAMGVKSKEKLSIIDATAGLGSDGFLLAYVGHRVTLIERSPVLHALLKDALARAKTNPQLAPALMRITLLFGDANTLLAKHHADVIYLDPMFPDRKKSAAVKKDMVMLHDLLGAGDEGETLFAAAMAAAKKRVVVKRPRLAPTLVAKEPNYSLEGKSSRFDIYLSPLSPIL